MRETSATDRLPGPGGAWLAAIIVVAISLLSTFSLENPQTTSALDNGGPGGDGPALPLDLEEQDHEAFSEGRQEERSQHGGGSRVVTEEGGQATTEGGQAGRSGRGSQNGSGPEGGPGQLGNYDCSKGQNAGATDVGVTPNAIHFGATVVKRGPAKSFLADAQFGMIAAINKKNAAGGVCGRRIALSTEDDGWEPDSGKRIIEKWVGGGKHFGLIVNPSSEGLKGALDGGLIAEKEFPVVGADGMLIGQYQSSWVWPVATSTYSVMHIMARHAYEKLGARAPAIVAETNYRFGYEGLIAFREEFKRLCKTCKIVEQEINGGQTSYKNQANRFVGSCKDGNVEFAKCDFIALLLEPLTASQWVRDNGIGQPPRPKSFKGMGAPQPLFVTSFVRNCREPCAGLWVWTSFKPPIYPFNTEPKVAEYVRDLQRVSGGADASNPHVQGAYVGANLLIQALEALGATPTRRGLSEQLDRMTFESGLAPPLTFKPGDHFAAVSAQAFEAIFAGKSFSNWQHAASFLTDQSVEADLEKLEP